VIPPPSVEHERLAHRLHVLLGPAASAAGLIVAGTIGIGSENDYRVPDLAVLRPGYAPQWNETAALVVEIISPRDDTWDKLPFYAARYIDEVVIVDPGRPQIHWLRLEGGEYRPIERSRLFDTSRGDLDALLG
jgi:Uma2 family endonuclease